VLLLDTHVWIWSLEGDARRIGRRARSLLTRFESRDAIRISPVTLFESTECDPTLAPAAMRQ